MLSSYEQLIDAIEQISDTSVFLLEKHQTPQQDPKKVKKLAKDEVPAQISEDDNQKKLKEKYIEDSCPKLGYCEQLYL